MSNISSYLKNNQYMYKRDTWQIYPSGASGVENTSGTSQISGTSGIDNTSGILDVSGASGYIYTQVLGTVNVLNINQVIELFTSGNLTLLEFEKWAKNKRIELNIKKTSESINISFTYQKANYNLSCANDAAESQLDTKVVQTYTEASLKYTYKFTNEQIAKYFDAVYTKNTNQYTLVNYAIKPNYPYSTAQELLNAVKTGNVVDNNDCNVRRNGSDWWVNDSTNKSKQTIVSFVELEKKFYSNENKSYNTLMYLYQSVDDFELYRNVTKDDLAALISDLTNLISAADEKQDVRTLKQGLEKAINCASNIDTLGILGKCTLTEGSFSGQVASFLNNYTKFDKDNHIKLLSEYVGLYTGTTDERLEVLDNIKFIYTNSKLTDAKSNNEDVDEALKKMSEEELEQLRTEIWELKNDGNLKNDLYSNLNFVKESIRFFGEQFGIKAVPMAEDILTIMNSVRLYAIGKANYSQELAGYYDIYNRLSDSEKLEFCKNTETLVTSYNIALQCIGDYENSHLDKTTMFNNALYNINEILGKGNMSDYDYNVCKSFTTDFKYFVAEMSDEEKVDCFDTLLDIFVNNLPTDNNIGNLNSSRFFVSLISSAGESLSLSDKTLNKLSDISNYLDKLSNYIDSMPEKNKETTSIKDIRKQANKYMYENYGISINDFTESVGDFNMYCKGLLECVGETDSTQDVLNVITDWQDGAQKLSPEIMQIVSSMNEFDGSYNSVMAAANNIEYAEGIVNILNSHKYSYNDMYGEDGIVNNGVFTMILLSAVMSCDIESAMSEIDELITNCKDKKNPLGNNEDFCNYLKEFGENSIFAAVNTVTAPLENMQNTLAGLFKNKEFNEKLEARLESSTEEFNLENFMRIFEPLYQEYSQNDDTDSGYAAAVQVYTMISGQYLGISDGTTNEDILNDTNKYLSKYTGLSYKDILDAQKQYNIVNENGNENSLNSKDYKTLSTYFDYAASALSIANSFVSFLPNPVSLVITGYKVVRRLFKAGTTDEYGHHCKFTFKNLARNSKYILPGIAADILGKTNIDFGKVGEKAIEYTGFGFNVIDFCDDYSISFNDGLSILSTVVEDVQDLFTKGAIKFVEDQYNKYNMNTIIKVAYNLYSDIFSDLQFLRKVEKENKDMNETAAIEDVRNRFGNEKAEEYSKYLAFKKMTDTLYSVLKPSKSKEYEYMTNDDTILTYLLKNNKITQEEYDEYKNMIKDSSLLYILDELETKKSITKEERLIIEKDLKNDDQSEIFAKYNLTPEQYEEYNIIKATKDNKYLKVTREVYGRSLSLEELEKKTEEVTLLYVTISENAEPSIEDYKRCTLLAKCAEETGINFYELNEDEKIFEKNTGICGEEYTQLCNILASLGYSGKLLYNKIKEGELNGAVLTETYAGKNEDGEIQITGQHAIVAKKMPPGNEGLWQKLLSATESKRYQLEIAIASAEYGDPSAYDSLIDLDYKLWHLQNLHDAGWTVYFDPDT